MTWQPSDEQVEAAIDAFDGVRETQPNISMTRSWDDHVAEWKAQMTVAMRAALIAAHAVQPPVDVDAFEAAVEDYCEARSTFSARTVFFGHGATRDDYEEQIAEALDAKRAAHQRLIRMYRERGL